MTYIKRAVQLRQAHDWASHSGIPHSVQIHNWTTGDPSWLGGMVAFHKTNVWNRRDNRTDRIGTASQWSTLFIRILTGEILRNRFHHFEFLWIGQITTDWGVILNVVLNVNVASINQPFLSVLKQDLHCLDKSFQFILLEIILDKLVLD